MLRQAGEVLSKIRQLLRTVRKSVGKPAGKSFRESGKFLGEGRKVLGKFGDSLGNVLGNFCDSLR